MQTKNFGHDGTDWKKISCDPDGNVNTNIKNLPSDYPDSNVLAKLVEVLTELEKKLNTSDLNIDASKDLQVDVKTQGEKDRQLYGWDGSAWQKLGLLFGYYDVYSEYIKHTASAGDNIVYSSIVPSDELWIINSTYARNVTKNIDILFQIYDGSTYIRIDNQTQTSTGFGVIFRLYNPIVIKPGERTATAFWGCNANDILELHLRGYKMKIS